MNIFNSILTSLITVILLILIICLIILLIVSKKINKKEKNEYESVKQKKADTVLIDEIDIVYDDIVKPFSKEISFLKFKEKLECILNDTKIKKIILLVKNIRLSSSQIDELEEIFQKLNKNKEVVSISDVLDMNSYKIAAFAKKIYLEDTINSTVILNGFKIKNLYFKNIFEKIGIKVNVLHVGDYKTAGENYSKNNMSSELKESLKKIVYEKLNIFYNFIKKYRNYDIEDDFLSGKLIFKYNDKLIDGRINEHEYISNEENLIYFSDYKIKKKKNKSKNKIAVLTLEGIISEKEISLKEVREKIETIYEDDNIKAMVLEIDSPGGSAYESSKIYNYIKNNIDVPIYISMKNVCASGGYYIATCGNKIFANKNTITGSIGVVSIYPTFDKILRKYKINYDGIKFGNNSDLFDFREYLSHDSKELLINHMKEVYEEFKLVVSKSRNINMEKLEELAQGKIYPASQAKEINLIDDIKTFDEIIDIIKSDLNIKDYKLIKLSKKISIKEDFKNKIPFLILNDLIYKPLFLMYKEKGVV